MSQSVVPPIGERIREQRALKGVTVRGLAREIGVSASLISQIETGRSQPSVSTLYAITTELGISIEDLFAERPNGPPELVADADALSMQQAFPHGASQLVNGAVAIGRHRDRRVGPIVHPDHREALTLESGVVWELLGQVPGVHVDFLLVTYQPGGSSSISGTLMRHSGTEYGYLISGELVLTLGFDEHHVQPGDAISFDSTTPHGYRNDGGEPAVGVWFVTESSH